MASAALIDLFYCEKLTVPQYVKVKFKLLSFGDWTKKIIDKREHWNHGTFNQSFCVHLEYYLGTALTNLKREDLNGFWCDGIAQHYISKKDLNDKRKIETIAWLGKSGQVVYQMTIYLGKYALRRCARGTDMLDCIPDMEATDWIEINPKERTIAIHLK